MNRQQLISVAKKAVRRARESSDHLPGEWDLLLG